MGTPSSKLVDKPQYRLIHEFFVIELGVPTDQVQLQFQAYAISGQRKQRRVALGAPGRRRAQKGVGIEEPEPTKTWN
jgi:hypothetical protein